MKKFKKTALLCACLAAALTFACSCASKSTGTATLLSEPKSLEGFNFENHEPESLNAVMQSAEGFSARFAAKAYESSHKENFAVSPVSVYTALALSAQCASGNTRSQLLTALNVGYESLLSGYEYFYYLLNNHYKNYKGDTTGIVSLGNSIWLDERAVPKQQGIRTLADKFFCYSYKADFYNDNAGANNSVRQFVREQTKGLIDKDFNLSDETLFTLINTLYLKDAWNIFGEELSFTDTKYDFTQSDGSVKSKKLLQGYYSGGKAEVREKYGCFYTRTNNDCTITFILPNDGYTLSQVFTEDTITEVDNMVYTYEDAALMERYYTRCFFPEYVGSYDDDVKDVLKEGFGITDFFNRDLCRFANLTDEAVYCSSVKHVAKLDVNKKGIEGAAATVVEIDNANAGPDNWKEVRSDFVLNKSFAYVLKDKHGITLFSGVVDKI